MKLNKKYLIKLFVDLPHEKTSELNDTLERILQSQNSRLIEIRSPPVDAGIRALESLQEMLHSENSGDNC